MVENILRRTCDYQRMHSFISRVNVFGFCVFVAKKKSHRWFHNRGNIPESGYFSGYWIFRAKISKIPSLSYDRYPMNITQRSPWSDLFFQRNLKRWKNSFSKSIETTRVANWEGVFKFLSTSLVILWSPQSKMSFNL